jgi:hypothetical protein
MTQRNPVPDFSLAPANSEDGDLPPLAMAQRDPVPDFSLAPANLEEILLPRDS